MRKPGKQSCHSPAFKVDNKEAYIFRTEIHCQRQNIRLQGLTLSGTCCSRNQSVGAVEFLMDIQITVRISCLFPG